MPFISQQQVHESAALEELEKREGAWYIVLYIQTGCLSTSRGPKTIFFVYRIKW